MSAFINIPDEELWIRKETIAFVQTNKKELAIQVCLKGEHEPFELKSSTIDEYNKRLQQLVSG